MNITRWLTKFDLLLLATWGVYFIFLFSRMVTLSPDQGLQVGHEYLWSDWASLHTGMVRIFATKPLSEWFAYHPIYADGKFTYPFLVNAISALLIRIGLSFESAMMAPYYVAFPLLLLGLRRLFTLVLQSQRLAVLAISLFFLSAGLSFYKVLAVYFATGSWDLAFPISSLHSAVPSHSWGANNFLIAMLLPQRAFALGLPVAVWAIYGFFSELLRERPARYSAVKMAASGVALGILPIVHAHSLIAASIVLFPAGVMALTQKHLRIRALYFAMPAAAVGALFYFIWIAGGIQTRFTQLLIGFTATSVSDWLWFWGFVWGVSLPLALYGTFKATQKAASIELYLAVAGLTLFILPNFFLFQPTKWDNSKLFLWAFLLLTPAMARALGSLYARNRYLGVGVALIATLTGALELADLQCVSRHQFQILQPQELALAEQVRLGTHSMSRFAAATTHNHFVSTWSARAVLVGYLGWIGNYGFNHQQTYEELREIYRGSPRTLEQIKSHRINYIVFGPAERRE
ncbi:MAG TPA: hypothetical protein PLH57_05510, partial [Oligoflexia bacterium]|nr:hypothetical protein [Oligoflexia bacterium]